MIGTVCLWNFSLDNKIAEIGYELIPDYQKKGFMTEAVNSVVNFAFNHLKLDKIEAYTHKENENSKKLLLTSNFNLNINKKDLNNITNVIYEIKNPSQD